MLGRIQYERTNTHMSATATSVARDSAPTPGVRCVLTWEQLIFDSTSRGGSITCNWPISGVIRFDLLQEGRSGWQRESIMSSHFDSLCQDIEAARDEGAFCRTQTREQFPAVLSTE